MDTDKKQAAATTTPSSYISVQNLAVGYGANTVQQRLNFTIQKQDIFFIIGGSGCGKTTLLKSMIGLLPPQTGETLYALPDNKTPSNFYTADKVTQLDLLKRWGVSFQAGALFSSMSVAENIALPLQLHSQQPAQAIAKIVEEKLALVELSDFADYSPTALSGGMRKRAGLARALALEPELLFFDEPSAGLDPISSLHLDNLIVQLARTLKCTVIIVSHELPSILAIGTQAVFLDSHTKTQLDLGTPEELRLHSQHDAVRNFLNRTDKPTAPPAVAPSHSDAH